MEETQATKRKVYLVFGRTQTCKSSFINDVSGHQHKIKVGQGNQGQSVTKSPKAYICKNPDLMPETELLFIDTIGWEDSDEEFTDDEILEKIEMYLLEHSNQDYLDGIILTESMTGDIVTVTNSLERVSRIFGCKCVGSIVVLGTKPNMVYPEALQERVDEVDNAIKKFRVKGEFLLFKTTYKKRSLPPAEAQIQFQELHDRLINLDAVPLETIREKRKGILERAEQIKKEETKSKEATVKYQEVKIEQEIPQIFAPAEIGNFQRVSRPKLNLSFIRRTQGRKLVPGTMVTIQAIPPVRDVPKVENKTKTETLEIEPNHDYCYRKALAEFKEKQRSEFKRGHFNRE